MEKLNKSIEEKIIMYDAPDTVKEIQVKAWKTPDGQIFTNEHQARYQASTHKICACGELMEKYYSSCTKCRNKIADEHYDKMPFKEWDGKTPFCLYDTDHYFFSEDDLLFYIEDEELTPEQAAELQLVLCEPNYPHEIDSSYWEDIIPENMDELPKEIQGPLDALNKALKDCGPLSWTEGKYRTKIDVK